MSISETQTQDCIAVDQSADHDELVTVVAQLVEENRELRQENREFRQEMDDLREQVETNTQDIQEQAKADARDRQRLTEAEDRLDDLEEGGSSDADPTPEADKTPDKTPIERLSDGDREDVAANVTPSVQRALALFEHLPEWGTSTPKGITLDSDDRPKDLLEAATGESLAWQQYYRACEALESLSKGAVTFIDHRRHGKTLVFHDDTDVHTRATTSNHGDSRPSLVAD